MHISAISTINDARVEDFANKTAVVIDVLRATSCIVTALANQCPAVIPVETVNQALQQNRHDNWLAGERFCKKISGFDFGNSPNELIETDFQNKKLIFTTTNGTRIVLKCRRAQYILCGSFLNARSCAEAIVNLQRDVILVCAGTHDKFSIEDSLCAGMLVDELQHILNSSDKEMNNVKHNDFAKFAHAAFLQFKDNIKDAIVDSENGKKLIKIGMQEDVLFCARTNQYPIVPILKNGALESFQF